MTFLEVLLLIEERGEQTVSDNIKSIRTNKHLYLRLPNGEYEESELPATEEPKFLPLPPPPPKEKKKR